VELAFLHNTKIDFIGKRYIFFALSIIIALAGAASLVLRGGPNYGIDFSGGVLIQMAFATPVDLEEVRSALNAGGITGIELQTSQLGMKSSIIIRAKKSILNQDELSAKVKELMKQKFPGNEFIIERTEYVGPAVGSQLFKQALLALIFSFAGIIVYVAFRFNSGVWGASGVIGIMHDVFVIFGIFSILNKEITLTIIAALLTIAGYSINDTIVVFDRIRENMRLLSKDTFANIINKSVNQTMSRTIITSLTVFMVALGLYFLGGEVLHDFAFALLLGVFVGTYSSIFVCSPLVYEWEEWKRHRTAAMFAGKRSGQK
jgi:preprotein translocase subunit SecF